MINRPGRSTPSSDRILQIALLAKKYPGNTTVQANLVVLVIRGYSTHVSSPELKPYHQMQVTRTPVFEVNSSTSEGHTVSVFVKLVSLLHISNIAYICIFHFVQCKVLDLLQLSVFVYYFISCDISIIDPPLTMCQH